MTIYDPFTKLFLIIGQFFLQSEQYGILDYLIIFLGPGLVLFFTFYLLWAGRRKNHKIINVTKDALLEIFSNEFDDFVTDQLSSNGGLLFPKYKKSSKIPFKDFRVVFALEERHLMLSVIISWFSGSNDYIAIEGNAKKGKLPTKIQIIPNHEEGQIKKHQDVLFQLKDITLDVERLDNFFLLKATSERMGNYFLKDKSLLKQIYSIREFLVRLSIDSSEDPSIRVYCRINKKLDLVKIHRLFLTLTERVNLVSEKKVMKK
ncbi:MAG: hypothetical protein ACW97Z_07330 [Candidatus Hodarchaeales archaeon]|jgi:hypothetical protein